MFQGRRDTNIHIYNTPVLEAACQNGRGRVLNYLSHILGGVS